MAQSLGAVVVLQLCLVGSGIAIARSLGPVGRGEAAVLLALPTIVMQIVCVGFPSALTYYIAQQRDDWYAIVCRVRAAATAQIVAGLGLLLALNAIFLAGKPNSGFGAGLVAMASLPALIFLYYSVHIIQGLGDIRRFNALRICAVGMYTAGIIALSLFGLTVMRCAIVWSVSQWLVALGALLDLLRRRRRLACDRPSEEGSGSVPSSGAIARFAMAGFLAQVSPIESFRVDTLVVAALFPPRIVGYYAVANSVTNAPLFAADALVAVGYPHVAAEQGGKAISTTRRYMKIGALLCGLAALLTAIALPVAIPLLFGGAYHPAVMTGELLAAAAAVLGLRRIGNDFVRALGRPSMATRLEVITLVALATCVAVLGGWRRGQGVALSLILAASVGVVLLGRQLKHSAKAARSA